MSRRLRITLPDDEYDALAEVALRRGMTIGQLIRESLRSTVTDAAPPNPRRDVDPQERVAAVLRFAGVEEPTGDIDQLLDEIERGRGLT